MCTVLRNNVAKCASFWFHMAGMFIFFSSSMPRQDKQKNLLHMSSANEAHIALLMSPQLFTLSSKFSVLINLKCKFLLLSFHMNQKWLHFYLTSLYSITFASEDFPSFISKPISSFVFSFQYISISGGFVPLFSNFTMLLKYLILGICFS